ncbi:hypothetical protein PUN28_006589 [Cardiocondyla obscurior]|uniref:Secreted protein n=1 Tax=Cardiocondyla obscurior TaxID=286306 RepID=A0AAW2GE54_9HYME
MDVNQIVTITRIMFLWLHIQRRAIGFLIARCLCEIPATTAADDVRIIMLDQCRRSSLDVSYHKRLPRSDAA